MLVGKNITIFGKTLDLADVMYTFFFVLGLIGALVIFWIFATKRKMTKDSKIFYTLLAIMSIGVGYYSAILFQMLYNFIDTGEKGAGSTFLGGLIGGAATFLLGYKFLGKKQDKQYINMMIQIAPCSITVAHGIGRLGCLMAGCCHGRATDSIFGIYFPHLGYKAHPTQLYEAIFLLVLCGILCFLFIKDKKVNMTIYLIAYGVFRFVLEYFRDDPRGEFIIPFLTPSQTISLFMVIIGVVFIILRYTVKPKKTIDDEKNKV